jgi:hypothetical protein
LALHNRRQPHSPRPRLRANDGIAVDCANANTRTLGAPSSPMPTII